MNRDIQEVGVLPNRGFQRLGILRHRAKLWLELEANRGSHCRSVTGRKLNTGSGAGFPANALFTVFTTTFHNQSIGQHKRAEESDSKLANQMIAISRDLFTLLVGSASFQKPGNADAQRSEELFSIQSAESDAIVGKSQSSSGGILMNIDTSAKAQVATSPSHNRIVSVLDKFPDWCVKSAIER